MTFLDLIEQSYQALIRHASDKRVKIILLHPNNRYRSLVVSKLLSETQRPVYYYAMGPQDVNVSAFITGFVYGLSEQAPRFGRKLNQLGQKKRTQNPELLLRAMIEDLTELSDKPYFLVLDDYDASEKADDVQQFLEALLLTLPDNCQVILNSRTLPRFPWVALIAKQHAVIFDDQQQIPEDPYQMEQEGALAKLMIKSLGPNLITKNGERVEQWEGHLPRLLLIFALERPVVTRTEICQSFWPNLDADQAVNVFHVTKRRLHKALGFDALIHEGGYYRVNPAIRIEYDVTQFVNALMRGRMSSGAESIEAWQEATELYQGPFLQGHDDEWIVQQRHAYQIGYFEAVIALADARSADGRTEQALRLLKHASVENSDYEPLHQKIMLLYSKLGRRSEAASHYQSMVAGLQGKGLIPSPETQALYDELMS